MNNNPALNCRQTVSVVVPCRNERNHIDSFFHSILSQLLPPGWELELVIAEGGSDDGTREVVEQYRKEFPEIIQVVDNPRGIVPTGLNAAIRHAQGEIILRMDVHTVYAADYIARCIEELERSGAANVGGPARTIGQGYVQEAICAAYHSPFFVGGAKFHDPNYEGYVDTVVYGCWRKTTLEQVGLFDEELVRSQDAELNLRIRKHGGQLWQSPKIRSWYTPRSSFRALARQYMQYGYWKFRVIHKHGRAPSLRQLVPATALAVATVLASLTPFSAFAAWSLAGLGLSYSLANTVASFAACRAADHWKLVPGVSAVFLTVHFSWAYGFVRGLTDFWLFSKPPKQAFETLTRAPATADQSDRLSERQPAAEMSERRRFELPH